MGHPYTVVPAQKADATLSQATPTSATLYEVLPTTQNVRVITVTVAVTWSAQPTPLEVVMTIDGQTIVFEKTNPVSAAQYDVAWSVESAMASQYLDTTNTDARRRAFFIEGRSIRIQVRTTGGTTSLLTARVKYAQY